VRRRIGEGRSGAKLLKVLPNSARDGAELAEEELRSYLTNLVGLLLGIALAPDGEAHEDDGCERAGGDCRCCCAGEAVAAAVV
jgi:hypothetical protein